MSSGIGVEDRCVEVFQDLKLKKKYKYIIYRIKDDFSQIYVDKVAESGSYEEFVKSLPANECRYAVYDFEYEKGNEGVRNKICFYAWAPEDSKIKNKMIYASSKDAIRKKLVGIASEIQATDFAEVAYDTILDKVSKSVSSLLYIFEWSKTDTIARPKSFSSIAVASNDARSSRTDVTAEFGTSTYPLDQRALFLWNIHALLSFLYFLHPTALRQFHVAGIIQASIKLTECRQKSHHFFGSKLFGCCDTTRDIIMTTLRAFEDKVTNYIRSSKRLSAIFMPLSQSFINLSGYRKMGFKYDDIICEETPAVQEALKRLSPRDFYDRTYRNRRAVQASLRHEVLDHKDWTKPEEDTAYLRPLLRQTEKEAAEKKLWDNGRL